MEKRVSSAGLVVAVALVAFAVIATAVVVSGCNLFMTLVR